MSDLRKVRRAAARVAASRSALESAMREAHEKGVPLRSVAKAAGMSHEQVRRTIARD